MTKRILHMAPGRVWGGVETMLVNLAKASSTKPDFALFYDAELAKRLRHHGANVQLLPPVNLSRPLSLVKARSHLKSLLPSYDIVVAHGLWTHVVLSLALGKEKPDHIVFLHDSINPANALEKLTKYFFPIRYLTNSRFLSNEAKAYFGRDAIGQVHCPVYKPNLRENAETVRHKIRATLGTPDDRVVILQVSRLEPIKGHELHLRALSELKEQDWECWMVGGHTNDTQRRYEHRLRELTRELGLDERVRFLDGRVTVAELMASADIYCQPNSGPEAFGVTFIEALYAGLPVVTTRLGSTAEIFAEEYGVLTPPGDASAVAAALSKLFRPEARLPYAQSGPARAKALCDPHEQVYLLDYLLGTTGRPALRHVTHRS